MNLQLQEDFFTKIGKADLSMEKKTEFTNKFLQTVVLNINVRMIANLSDTQAEEYSRLSSQDSKAAQAYLKAILPDYNEIILQEFEDLQQEIIEGSEIVASASAAPNAVAPGPPPPPPPTI